MQAWREQFAYALREQGIEANATPAAIRGKGKSSAKSAIHQHQDRLEKWRVGAKDGTPTQTQPVPSALLQSQVERVLEELVNGVQPDLTRQEKLLSTRDKVLNGWKATETALRDQGFFTDANRVVEFIKNLPSVKTDHDLLKETMLADQGRLQAALGKLPMPPTHNKGVAPGDDLTLVR